MLYRYTHSMPRFYAGLLDVDGNPVGVLEPGATVDLPETDDPWLALVDGQAKAAEAPTPPPVDPALEQAAEALLLAAETHQQTEV